MSRTPGNPPGDRPASGPPSHGEAARAAAFLGRALLLQGRVDEADDVAATAEALALDIQRFVLLDASIRFRIEVIDRRAVRRVLVGGRLTGDQ